MSCPSQYQINKDTRTGKPKRQNKKRGDHHQIQSDPEADSACRKLPSSRLIPITSVASVKPCIQHPTKPFPLVHHPSLYTYIDMGHMAHGPNFKTKRGGKKKKENKVPFFVHPCGKSRSDMHRNHAMSLFIFVVFVFCFLTSSCIS